MGLGSYISKYIHHHLFNYLIWIEITIGIIGGLSAIILFALHVYTPLYSLWMYLLTLVIGGLVGIEIPILIRIIEDNNSEIKQTLANLFAFDYLGGLIGSLLFPLILLPKLGYIAVSLVTGLLNLLAATLVLSYYKTYIDKKVRKKSVFFSRIALILMTLMLFNSEFLSQQMENGLYRDTVVLSQQSLYQKIVATKHKDDFRLFLDGNTQFSTKDEYRYHEALVHVPMNFKQDAQNVLLLGAGDGLAARELLKYPSLKEIVIVDLDKEMVDLSRTYPDIVHANQGALDDERVNVVIDDAYMYLQAKAKIFDVIIIDLPDPNNEALNKLYTTSFYRLVRQNLAPEGVMVTQSSSPYYTSHAFWCINKTIAQEFKTVYPYHLYVPSFGDWGFNMATNSEMSLPPFRSQFQYQYLTPENYQSLFTFASDEQQDIESLQINTLNKPVLIQYYENDVNSM